MSHPSPFHLCHPSASPPPLAGGNPSASLSQALLGQSGELEGCCMSAGITESVRLEETSKIAYSNLLPCAVGAAGSPTL